MTHSAVTDGLDVRLDESGVAGDERGDRVAHRQCQRVVPWRDEADDALGLLELRYSDGAGEDPAVPARSEQPTAIAGVVPGGDADVEQLLDRVAASLAGLPLDDVETLVAVREDQIVEPEHDAGPLLQGTTGPRPLPMPQRGNGIVDVGLRGQRQFVDLLSGERGVHRPGAGGVTDADPRQEPSDETRRRGHAVTTISTRWNSFMSL